MLPDRAATDSPDRPDTGRPGLHFTPRRGWINDPHGISYHGGRYHVFFQHVPDSTTWQPGIAWGHATSPDLLRWTEHPVALRPGDGNDGCFTGGIAVPDVGPAVLLYTSVRVADIEHGQVRIARPADDTWTAWHKGPVLTAAPDGCDLSVYRDPAVLREGTGWRMLVGAGFDDGTPAALSYSSPDLAAWSYDGPLDVRTPPGVEAAWTGAAWECPQLVPVGDRHVLVVSVWDDAQPGNRFPLAAAVGRYAGGAFEVARWQQITAGPGHFAASAFTFADGGPGLMFWLRDVADHAAGWAGALSLPYRVSLDGDRAVLQPDDAVAAARVEPGPGGHQAVDVEWTPSAQERLDLVSAGGRVLASLVSSDGSLTVTTTAEPPVRVPLTDRPVRVLVDGPVLELTTGETLVGLALPSCDNGVRPRPAAGAGLQWWALGTG